MPLHAQKGWAHKPPSGSQINWGSPSSVRLKGCWLFNESSGNPYNLVNAKVCTRSGITWSQSFSGSAIKSNSDTDYIDTNDFTNMSAFKSGTVVWRAFPAFAAGDSLEHFFWGTTDSATSVTKELTCQKYLDNSWYIGWNSVGQDNRVVLAAGSTNFTQNAWQDYAFTWSPTDSIFYRNGLMLANKGSGAVTVTTGLSFRIANSPFTFGVAKGISTGSKMDFLYLYDRPLSHLEIKNLYSDPFSIIQIPRKRRIWTSTSTSTTFFRKTLSGIGSRAGSRQVHGWN